MGGEPKREIDKEIISALKESGQATPSLIAKLVDRDRRYVANRLLYLAKNKMIKKVVRGVYRPRE